MPTPAALVVVGLGLAGACRPEREPRRRRRRRLAAWGLLGAAVALYFTVIEHRFLHFGSGERDGLTLLHSAVYPVRRQAREAYVGRLIEAGADLTILSNPLDWRDIERLRHELGEPIEVVRAWPFMVITRLPVLEARPLVANNETYVAMFRLDTTAELGRPITVYAVDLPSNPKRARHDIARAARRMLEGTAAPPPEVVVGDFNMTRGSASLKTLFPGLAHAYDQAGRGYGATFSRGFPLYHLDHTLLSDTLTATDYVLIDLETGRHLAQWVELAPGPGGG
jgi:endonuclease/exonuclease/phosphatase family metal-dependent hydrolase